MVSPLQIKDYLFMYYFPINNNELSILLNPKYYAEIAGQFQSEDGMGIITCCYFHSSGQLCGW